MDYLGLTTTLQIRATLTVSEEDLADSELDAFGLEDDLAVALDSAFKGAPVTWESIAQDVTVPLPTNTRRLRVFAKYFCAATLAVTAQNFILKKIADGSNEAGRSDKDGYAWMAPALMAKAEEALDAIMDDLEVVVEVKPLSVISRVIPDRDPITTPRATT